MFASKPFGPKLARLLHTTVACSAFVLFLSLFVSFGVEKQNKTACCGRRGNRAACCGREGNRAACCGKEHANIKQYDNIKYGIQRTNQNELKLSKSMLLKKKRERQK